MPQTQASKKMRYKQRQLEIQKKQKMQRLMGWTLAGFLVIAVIVLLVYSNTHSTASASRNGKVDPAIFQYEKHPVQGSPSAPVKIVEFADYKCPVCKQFDQTILPQITQDFVKNGTVQYYFINDPIISPNADSKTAALAGEAVYHQNPQAFWKYTDAVYANQGDERSTWATADTLVRIAKEMNLPLDDNKLKHDIDAGTYASDVKNDESIAQQAGVTGTPTLFINGQQVPAENTFNYTAIKNAILQAKGEKK